MRGLQALKIRAKKKLAKLDKRWGLEVQVFYPIAYPDLALGAKSENIDYAEEADETVKALIPAILKERMETFSTLIDPLIDDFDFMYLVDPEKSIPYASKIVIEMLEINKVYVYKVEDPKEFNDESVTFLRKYKIIPMLQTDHIPDQENLVDGFLDELENPVEDIPRPDVIPTPAPEDKKYKGYTQEWELKP